MANHSQFKRQLSPTQTNQLIQLYQNQHFSEAASLANKLIQSNPDVFMLHHLHALCSDALGQFAYSINSYKKAIALEPKHAELYFNLGIAYANVHDWNHAIESYQHAIQLNPNLFEAYGNLGIVYQTLGNFEQATSYYQHGLAINPQDARGHFNLGTVLRDQGLLESAIEHYQAAISLFPNYVDAYCNLGETYRDHGDMQSAVNYYQKALAIYPDHPQANYNMGEFLYLKKSFKEASNHFEKSQHDDWLARSLYSLYKGEIFNEFEKKLNEVTKHQPHMSPLIATLATHYSINFETPISYNFCQDPLKHVYHKPIEALKDPSNPLLKDLLHDIEHADIQERVQGMLHYGQQSAGNLFKRPEQSFQQLAKLVLAAFADYKQQFLTSKCALIEHFPEHREFTSSWYVKMRKGGHLSPHIHEIGWISGAVYLAMPEPNGLEGAFEFGVHGDDYPIQLGKLDSDFPKGHVVPTVGDIVLFPSSLFHRTVPFSADTQRICVAFDLKPVLN